MAQVMPSEIRSSKKRLSIVFLNYNRVDETRQTVELLRRFITGRSDVEIIAVDNGSRDGTREYLKKQDDVISIFLTENSGIAGYNQGFVKATGDLILVLDDDSSPLDADMLDRVLEIFDENPEIGVVACHIQSRDGTPQWSWHLPQLQKFGPSPFFVGCGFAIRRELFARIGWYPGKFFLYQNEIEVAFQVRKCKYDIIYDPDCRIVHRGEPSTRPNQRRIYYPTRNTIWIIKKYYPQPQASYLLFSRLVIGFGRALYFKEFSAYRDAVRDAFREPIERQTVSSDILAVSIPFWKQNSIFHQLFKIT